MSLSAHPLAPMLRKFLRTSLLDQEDREAILNLPYQLRSIRRGSYVVRDGEVAHHACLIVSGYAYRHKLAGDGGRQILAIQMKGDFVDLHNAVLGTADHNVQTLTDVEAAFIPVQAVRALAFSHPRVGLAMWVDTAVDGSIHREWTTNLGRRDARTRLAHLLCEFGVRLEEAGLGSLCEYQLPMTQEELADAVGLTAVHVNRTLKLLDREGLTARTLRAVTIHDWDALAAAGDFDRHYLHLGDAREAA
ncbi:MAG: Crp/Fnr family transcriptional regulator [Allosphingosinicella sp.]